MAMITNDWLDAVKPEFSKEYYKDLFCFVKDEYSKCVVYPPADDIYLSLCGCLPEFGRTFDSNDHE